MPKFANALNPARLGRLCTLLGAIVTGFRKLRTDRTGGVTIILALSLPAMIGFAGLGTEAAKWYLTRRTMQGAADTAAAAAASALAAGTTNPAVLASEAKSIAAYYNFVNGSNGTTVTVNYPPKSGTHQTNSAVEVVIRTGIAAALVAVPAARADDFRARRGARQCQPDRRGLRRRARQEQRDIDDDLGNGQHEFPGCSLYVNSPNSSALNMNGGATIHPNIAYIAGGYSGGGLTTENGTYVGVDPLLDPYRTVTVPAYSGCDSNNYKLVAGKTESKTVGSSGVFVFCKGVELEGNSSLTLGPGTFIISGTPTVRRN